MGWYDHFARRIGVANLVKSVAHGSNFRIRFEGFRDRGKLPFRPPVIPIEEGYNLALKLGNSGIEAEAFPPSPFFRK